MWIEEVKKKSDTYTYSVQRSSKRAKKKKSSFFQELFLHLNFFWIFDRSKFVCSRKFPGILLMIIPVRSCKPTTQFGARTHEKATQNSLECFCYSQHFATSFTKKFQTIDDKRIDEFEVIKSLADFVFSRAENFVKVKSVGSNVTLAMWVNDKKQLEMKTYCKLDWNGAI